MYTPKIAIILCGSGRADGSEIHESVSVLIACSRHNAHYRCFAPDQPQADVINHLTGKPEGEPRNCLVEAARIARGEISPLSTLRAADYDALILPGGFGAAKNLCTFAAQGASMTVHPDVERAIKAFHTAHKPIGLCCIAPVIAAKVLGTASGGPGCSVTVGHAPPVAEAIAAWGSRSVPVAVTEAHADETNRLFTAPAYMDDHATPHQVYQGIERMVAGVVDACRHAPVHN